MQLTEALIDDTLFEVEMIARKLIAGVTTGEKRKTALADVTNRFSNLASKGTIQTKRAIAKAFNESRQYIS